MTETDIYKIVKSAILKTEPCPDGSGGMACASCLAGRYQVLQVSRFSAFDFRRLTLAFI